LRVAPVVLVGLDAVAGQDETGAELDDGDGCVVGDGEYLGAAVGVADAEVVRLAGAAEADLAPTAQRTCPASVAKLSRAQPLSSGRG